MCPGQCDQRYSTFEVFKLFDLAGEKTMSEGPVVIRENKSLRKLSCTRDSRVCHHGDTEFSASRDDYNARHWMSRTTSVLPTHRLLSLACMTTD